MAILSPMGIGALGSPNILFKSKFRWIAEWRDPETWQLIAPITYVKVNARPQMTVEETETMFLNGQYFVMGRKRFDDITLTYWDVENDEGAAIFFSWVSKLYMQSEGKLGSMEKACIILKLIDAVGDTIETWYLDDVLVTALNFGDNGYTTAVEPISIEVTARYGSAELDVPTWTNSI